MLKKVFKTLTTLSLLAGTYLAYVHAFDILVHELKANNRTDNFAFPIHDSKSLQDSIRYAIEACGPNHWAADKELAYRYYNAERGYWIYAKECVRVVEENGVRYDGKRMRMKPFLLITKSQDGKNTKTITADRAVFDLNAPLGFDATSGREPLKIKHAHLEPNVWVRDDKGTPRDPSDDMKIGPLTTVDYEESTQQITTEADTYVVMQDPDITATGYGMLMQLRKNDDSNVGTSSSGFQGLERLDLLKDVHLIIRDVGKSGMLPGSDSSAKAMPTTSTSQNSATTGSTDGGSEPPKSVEPTPLDLRCDSKMQIFLPKSKSPVPVGPPAPPAPTFAQFDRNVVVLRGNPDDGADQLTCDTLKLTLIPEEQLPPQESSKATPKHEPQPAKEVAQDRLASTGTEVTNAKGGEQDGLFGGLTLQRAHATGHAVWLILPGNGIKLRCNEMIHMRQLPLKPDQTYFRGDSTRPVEIVKVDIQHSEDGKEEPDQGKVTSVTNIWAVDLTLFDSGVGMDAANVVAHGPGRLETRPDFDRPSERIAIWQDKLTVVNTLGPNNVLVQKKIDLTGNRPCFIDSLQKTSLDSASLIRIWLKPKLNSTLTQKSDLVPTAFDRPVVDTQHSASPLGPTNPINSTNSSSVRNSDTPTRSAPKADMGGGNLRIDQLHAMIDVHLLAPAKTMTARSRLDAEFVEAKPPNESSGALASSKPESKQLSPAPATADAGEPTEIKASPTEPVTDSEEKEKHVEEPLMNGSCDRIWARIELKPKSPAGNSATNQASSTKGTSTEPKKGESDAEIRKLWMFGNVALHQDPKPNQKKEAKIAGNEEKGMNASGEALYLDNRGTNKVITFIYQNSPTNKTPLPEPVPPARVANIEPDDVKVISAAGVIQMNQETDQVWVDGPGTLTQLADRDFLTDKASSNDEEPKANTPGGKTKDKPDSHANKITIRSTSMARIEGAQDRDHLNENETNTKPKTRAGVPLNTKAPMTISFSENMEFRGRAVDPEGRPAAHTDFQGIVVAEMEDAKLYCTQKMITFTDREVPLNQLGKMTQKRGRSQPGDAAKTEESEPEPQPELALLFCYRNAVGIIRKVDPDLPVPIQQQRIEADRLLAYDRRTGDFFVEGKGKVFLYDRDSKASQTPVQDRDTKNETDLGDDSSLKPTSTQRKVVHSTSRGTSHSNGNAKPKVIGVPGTRRLAEPYQNDEQNTGELTTMLLTQIHFNKRMIGRFGSGKQNDQAEDRWSEFYGNVEAFRAKVANTKIRLNPDRLPTDGMFLTGETLQVIQEPPPVNSPEHTPARQYLKAEQKAYVWSHDKALNADLITYDSYKDLVIAYGKDGHNVVYAEQHAAGQPISPGSAEIVQLNPKTGALHLWNSSTIGLIDKNTGYRPAAAAPDDPYARKKKPVKKPFKLPTQNLERRQWTGT